MLALLLAAAMAIPQITIFAETDGTENSVSEGAEYLYGLGIIKDNPYSDFRYDDLITRGEFAGWLAGAYNIPSGPYEITFSDVSEDDPNAESIALLKQAGIMVGSGDGTFSPSKPILMEEALKSAVVLLGYKQYAEAAGGYPGGYFKVGYEKNLLDGVGAGENGGITRENAAELLWNTMSAYVMEPSGTDKNGMVYSEKYDKTLLYKTREILRKTGKVTANSVTDLEGGTGIAKGMLEIDGAGYEDKTENGAKLLGRKTEFFYKEGTPDELIYIKAEKRTETVILNSEDIDSFDGKVLKYYRGSKSAEYKLSSMADVIYNGKVLDFSKNDILFRDDTGTRKYYGTIELTDNDSDGRYDVMDIHAYHNLIVSSVRTLDSESGKTAQSQYFEILDKNGSSIKINPEKTYTLKNDKGENISWTSLNENDVLAAAESKDLQNIEMYLCTEVITGEISSISKDGEKYLLTINGESYEIVPDTGFYCIDRTDETIGLSSGDKAFFTLDKSGRIALAKDKSKNTGLTYGLIINYFKSDDENDVRFKIMRASGDIEIINAENKITIDGKTYKGTENIINKMTQISGTLNGRDNGGNVLRKEILVKYRINSDGNLIQLDTPYLNAPDPNENEQTLHVMKLKEQIDGVQEATDPANLIYRANTFGGKIVVDSSTLFFYLPPVSGANDLSTYAVLPAGQLKIDLDHTIRAYTSNVQKLIPEAVCIYSSPVYSKNTSEINKGTAAGIYLKKSTGLDMDENVRDCISIFQDGHVITKCVESASVENFGDLSPGDVIRFGTNTNANIDVIHMVYKHDENRLPRQGLGNAPDLRNSNLLFTNGGARAIFGGVYSKENNVIAVVNQIQKYRDNDNSANNDGGILVNDNMANLSQKAQASIERYDISKYEIYRYNADSKTAEKVSAADINAYQQTKSEYDYALVFTVDYRPGTVILYSKDDVSWN